MNDSRAKLKALVIGNEAAMQTPPETDELTQALLGDLPESFRPRFDGHFWTLYSSEIGQDVTMRMSGLELSEWVRLSEATALDILGVEPAWKSAIGMIGVYIGEKLVEVEDAARQWLAYGDGEIRVVDKPQ